MNLATTITITVYFLGLVSFSPGSGTTREVVAPFASPSITLTVPPVPPVALQVHQADIVISGVSPGDCSSLGGFIALPSGKCTILGVQGRFITLPAGTPSPLDTSAHNVPKLTALCPAITGIKPVYLTDPEKYAVRLTLSSGTLDSCQNGAAWGSRLVLGDVPVNSELKVEDKIAGKTTTLKLSSDTTIHIMNGPTTHPATSGAEHFWWHYVIANNTAKCTALPTSTPTGSPCAAAFAARSHSQQSGGQPAATGLGCSNSQYP
jgi:hypothetical protein